MCDCRDHCERCHPELVYGPEVLLGAIKPGDRVTIRVPAGIGRNGVEYTERTGRAVMRVDKIEGPMHTVLHWVLNMGRRYGTLGIATTKNLVRVDRRKPDVAEARAWARRQLEVK
jgi:hypothetical protein